MWKSILLCCFSLTASVFSEELVRQYTMDDFSKNIRNNKGTFVMFYAPWCSHCTVFYPIWNQLAQMLNFPESKVTIAKVDCTTDYNLCKENDIIGYPTLLYYKQNSIKPSEYRGSRDLPSLSLFLNEVMAEINEEKQVTKESDEMKIYKGMYYLTDQNFDKFVSSGQHFIMFYAPWCAVSQALAPTWSTLAEQYDKNESIKISKIDCMQEQSTCLNFDIKDYPHLIWMVNGKVMEAITGPHSLEELEKFVETMARPENHNPERFLKKKISAPVARISEETFDLYMKQDLVFVNYFAGWCAHCKLMVPTWLELAKNFQDNSRIIIADVDCGQDNNLCIQEEIHNFPTLVLYKNSKVIYQHKGSTTLDDLTSEVEKHLNEKESNPNFIDKDEL